MTNPLRKLKDAICPKCGQENVYVSEDGFWECFNCFASSFWKSGGMVFPFDVKSGGDVPLNFQ